MKEDGVKELILDTEFAVTEANNQLATQYKDRTMTPSVKTPHRSRIGDANMLKRIHIQGYKSLEDVEVSLSQLVVLFGPNAAGKSNLLDALQLLSKLGTSRTVKEAFDPPYRGKPLESFTIGQKGIKGLLKQERLSFSIEADLNLSDVVVETVNRQILEMRRPHGEVESKEKSKIPARVRERNLRYRIEVEMLPRSGVLRVADEYLAALNSKGEPTGKRKPFLERQGERIHLRHEGQAHPTYYDRYLDHSILSMPHYPPHYPHLAAARRELESWLFFYFEPRERMRAANPVKEVRHIGLMGEELAAFLNTMKSTDEKQFRGVEKALHALMPNIDGIEVEVSDLGEVELRLKEGGVAIPARVLSEGTLRMLGLLALTGVGRRPGTSRVRGARKRRSPAPDPVDRGIAKNTGNPEPDPAYHYYALAYPTRSTR